MSSLRSLHVLRWHCTKPVAAHPTGVTMFGQEWKRRLLSIFLILLSPTGMTSSQHKNDSPEDPVSGILAEGALALSVTLSGGALFAS